MGKLVLRALFLTTICATLLFSSVFSQAQSGPAGRRLSADGPVEGKHYVKPRQVYASDRLLVRFRSTIKSDRASAAHAQVGARVSKSFRSISGLALVQLPPGMTVAEAIRRYRENPDVLYAEPDYVLHLDDAPNDPLFPQLWGLNNTGQTGGMPRADIHALEAWAITTGSSDVVVGVIDSGVDYNHPDLAANIFRNEVECIPDELDSDGNGYVDDCYGINLVGGTSDPMDDHGHGTHVAGTIGAVGNNSLGVIGVNWQVKIAPCKFLAADGSGLTSDAIACLNYMAALKRHGVNLIATNNSWGGGAYSQALYDAIDAQRQLGILFIAAAGNEASDSDSALHFPSGFDLPNVISVAATDASDQLAQFSNFGRTSVHLGAPGVDILSTFPNGQYYTASGTSMASPHVTGVAALLKAQDPSRDWLAIKNLILAGSDPLNALANTVTGSRLNAASAMTCNGRRLLATLRPHGTTTTVMGLSVDLAALNINCAQPAGDVDVAVVPDNTQISLADAGVAPDIAAHDGVAAANWNPTAVGKHSFTLSNQSSFDVQVLSPYRYRSVPMEVRQFSGTVLASSHDDDDRVDAIDAPFPILFGGGEFTRLHISTNGLIGLSGVPRYWGNADDLLPTGVAAPESTSALVAPLWLDLIPTSDNGGQTVWGVTGLAPNRELVVEWRNLAFYGCACRGAIICGDPQGRGEVVTFQVVFFEGQSKILFNYPDATFGGTCTSVDSGRLATVGVQVTPLVATQAFSSRSPGVSSGTALLWELAPPVPQLSQVVPFSAITGGPAFSLKLVGNGFLPGSAVQWNGADRPTHFVSSVELTADIPASDIANSGQALVRVVTAADAGSLALPFDVYSANPAPTLSWVSPSSICTTCDVSRGVDLTGTNFVTGAVARWDGSPKPTVVTNSTRAHMEITRDDIALAGPHQITIENPAPGGGVSNPVAANLYHPQPSIYWLSLTNVAAGGPAFTLDIVGAGFDSASVVRWNGADRPTTLTINCDSYGCWRDLHAQISAADIATPGTAEVSVFNPAPGGGLSNLRYVSINVPVDNDTFDNATEVTSNDFTRTQDVTMATDDWSDPQPCVPGDYYDWNWGWGSVWYRFTAPVEGFVSVDTNGSDYDTILLVTGASGTCNDDFLSPASFVFMPVSAGATYYFMVRHSPADWYGHGNSLTFNLKFATDPPQRPANDDVANALAFTVTPFSHTADITYATREANEPDCNWGRNVWYTFTPPTDGYITINPAGSNTSTSVAAYSGMPANLALLGCNIYDPVYTPLADVSANVTAGTPYYFVTAVSDEARIYSAAQVFNFSFSAGQRPRPANDDFANAKVISTATFTDTVDTSLATTEPTDPPPCPFPTQPGPSPRSLWYRFAPASDGVVTFDFYQSSYDVQLSIVTGTAGNFAVRCDFEYLGWPTGTRFTVTGGETYYLMATSYQQRLVNGNSVVFHFAFRSATDNPVPSVTSLLPYSVVAGSPAFTLGVSGTQFVNGATVLWDGNSRSTSYLSSTALEAQISAADVASQASHQVSVFNPAPGGGISASVYFTVTPQPGRFALTVARSGTGSGNVTSSPAGIDCGTNCSAEFGRGIQITLTATSMPGSVFAGWSGDCTGTGACAVTMDGVRSVTATFNPEPSSQFRLSVTKPGDGVGTVTSSPPGIDCGSTCSADFGRGSQVTLAAAAGAMSVFTGWSGDCTGTGTCVVTMSATHAVTATFNLPSSFDLPAPSSSTATIRAGQAAQFTLTVNPQNGAFSSVVSFSCMTGVPPRGACSFSPASVTPGSAPATTILSVSTAAPSGMLGSTTGLAIWVTPGLLGLAGFGFCGRTRRRQKHFAFLLLMLLVLTFVVACGGGSSITHDPGTPPGTYTVTVAATGGTTTKTTNLTVVVQ